ncbi:MAG: phosphoribosylformylglycinamidine cyclo-ligase [Parcubacteria group bacterium]|nr:phosphoribosylformylglycinamidine cyclo-ligase [Parcubacteria group bacterium]
MITYKDAGVDIAKKKEILKKIKKIAESTHNYYVESIPHGYGGCYNIAEKIKRFSNAQLICKSDGVGTKTILAVSPEHYITCGRDIISHCADDLLCSGAQPILFLDYLGMSNLKEDVLLPVVSGMAAECRAIGIPLLGGETAEMPDIYQNNQYDIVGFMNGLVEKDAKITGSSIKAGDQIIGLKSNGLHTNGYSLIREIMARADKVNVKWIYKEKPLTDYLLQPHANYTVFVQYLLHLRHLITIKGIAHITGGSFEKNVERILPENVSAIIDTGLWRPPDVFQWIMEQKFVELREMYRVFNMGIGLILVVEPQHADFILGFQEPFEPKIIGHIQKRADSAVIIH